MPLKNKHLQTPRPYLAGAHVFDRQMSILNAASHGTHPPQTISPFPPLAFFFFFFFGTVVTLVVMTTKNGPRCQHSWTTTHFVFLSGSGDWGCLQESGFPPDQRATVKAYLDDHSAGLLAFFWGFMLLWVVRTLTQLVECGGHTVQYGDSPVSRDIVLCLWYKKKNSCCNDALQ